MEVCAHMGGIWKKIALKNYFSNNVLIGLLPKFSDLYLSLVSKKLLALPSL